MQRDEPPSVQPTTRSLFDNGVVDLVSDIEQSSSPQATHGNSPSFTPPNNDVVDLTADEPSASQFSLSRSSKIAPSTLRVDVNDTIPPLISRPKRAASFASSGKGVQASSNNLSPIARSDKGASSSSAKDCDSTRRFPRPSKLLEGVSTPYKYGMELGLTNPLYLLPPNQNLLPSTTELLGPMPYRQQKILSVQDKAYKLLLNRRQYDFNRLCEE